MQLPIACQFRFNFFSYLVEPDSNYGYFNLLEFPVAHLAVWLRREGSKLVMMNNKGKPRSK